MGYGAEGASFLSEMGAVLKNDGDRISGASTVRYLPSYSPDLNPIEKLFSKLKALLCKAAKRNVEALWQEIGKLLDSISAEECSNYFLSCGYVNT